MTNSFRTSNARLDGPGQLIANLPGFLGFYPEDSLIFAALEKTKSPGSFKLGPILRINLEDIPLVPRVLASLKDYEVEFSSVLSFLVTERDREEVMLSGRDISLLAASNGVHLEGIWWAERVLSGEPYHCLFGPPFGAGPPSPACHSGVIPPVTQAVSLGKLAEHGELPEISRLDAFRHVARDNHRVTDCEAEQLSDFARSYAIELVTQITETSPYRKAFHPGPWDTVDGIVEDVGYLLTEIEEQDLSVEELMDQQEILLSAAVFLSANLLRDIILEDLVVRPRPAARLMLALARTFGGSIRANALCGYSVAYLRQGLSMRALPALSRAVEEFPGHTLSEMLHINCHLGLFDNVIDRVRRGSRSVRITYGIADPEHSDAAA
ncbi:DUF4192 domain-containing protein [Corynebacterium atrinae]